MMWIDDEAPVVPVQNTETTDAPPSPGTLLTSAECAFLEAVRNNDIELVRRFCTNNAAPSNRTSDHRSSEPEEIELQENQSGIDVNCMDSNGETALQIAVKNESLEMVKLLLKHGADIGSALLQAVKKGSNDYVQALLEFDNNNGRSSQRNLAEVEATDNNRYLTPLILASHNNSYDIVKLLLSKGHVIESVHNRGCHCSECSSQGRLGHSLRRLYTYRALASPVYMSLKFLKSVEGNAQVARRESDPIRQAFELNKELEELAVVEYEFRDEYLQLSKQCEEFAVGLLDQCQDMAEIEQIMSVPDMLGIAHKEGDPKSLGVLNFAISNKNERFVAHPYSQMMLNSVIYGGLHKWEQSGVIMKIIAASLFTALLPIWALIYIFSPQSRVSRKLSTPILKFISHTGSFLIFLVLLILSSFQDLIFNPRSVTVLDVLLAFWIFGLIIQEMKDCYKQGKERYFSKWWTMVTLAMLGSFIVSGVLWVVGSALSEEHSGNWGLTVQQVLGLAKGSDESYRWILLSNTFFALGLLLSFLHMSNTLQVNATLGPLQLSIVKMIRDITKFLLLFFFIYVAFVVALRKVYSQYVWAGKTFLNQTGTTSTFASVQGSMHLMFWAIFDKTELSEFNTADSFPTKITQNTGEILFALFNISTILVAINMLIAMMTNSYQKVADAEDIQWKFSRTRMWMEYIGKGSTLPPPFSIVPSVPSIIRFFRQADYCMCCNKMKCGYCTEARGKVNRTSSVDERFRTKILRRLIERYFYSIEKGKSSTEPAVNVAAFFADVAQSMRMIVQKLERAIDRDELTRDTKLEVEEIIRLWNETERKHFQVSTTL